MTEGYNVIITIGSLMGDATALKAKQYLDIKFAIIDTTRGKETALKLIGNLPWLAPKSHCFSRCLDAFQSALRLFVPAFSPRQLHK